MTKTSLKGHLDFLRHLIHNCEGLDRFAERRILITKIFLQLSTKAIVRYVQEAMARSLPIMEVDGPTYTQSY